jgi:hypothetical protein
MICKYVPFIARVYREKPREVCSFAGIFFLISSNGLWLNPVFWQTSGYVGYSIVLYNIFSFKDTPWEVYRFHRRIGQDGTTPKGYLIQTQSTVYNTTHTDQMTRTRLVPSTAKNGEEAIHRASRPRHNRRELHETDSNSGRHKPTHCPPISA